MLSGDKFYDDDTTAGPLYAGDPYAWPCDQCDAGTQYGILFSHASEMVWPDLIGRAFPTVENAQAYGASVTRAQRDIECAVMRRSDAQSRWLEVGTGQTTHQVIARLWSARIAGSFGAGALH
jgi:hypothetical protein